MHNLHLPQFTLHKKTVPEALASINKLQNLHLDNDAYLQVLKLKYKVLIDSGFKSEGEKTLDHIRELDPSFNKSDSGKNFIILIPGKIRPYIEKAESLRKNGQLSEALSVLKESNSIQEISYTDLLIGKILFSEKKVEALYYLEKAHKELKSDPSLDYCLSMLYLIKHDIPKAKKSIDDFVKLQGENQTQSVQLRNLFKKITAGENISR